ncbi:glycoside hydrolase family 16 protein [Flavivirga sp. 57AJ16]|uniref:glycoside hydrolase family 16 protein n=1 Tax=Flavivirga sp. 57AJ16 TaxID=3025307 RepID=UPI00236578BD|nr:glycoside hydrolase family 16 protein [Flavivirga sp. 57AJ16]MDD7885951.1 glycoside hydrolase family 16 protein [Flavivirga sp. 57AJ16]
MKKFKYSYRILIILALIFTGCQEDDIAAGDIIAPSNIQVAIDIVGADASNPNGDGSGTVNFTASADNAISYQYVYNNNTTSARGGKQSYDFSVLGLNTYSVTIIAFGTGGASSSKTVQVEVLSLYDPPADLIEMLHGGSEKTWRIKAESKPHFGLGPVGGTTPGEWFSAEPFDKAAVGMYDDRYVFNADGTFTHITDSTNDDPTMDTSGTVFGRDPLINELGGPGGGTVDGADILNYPFSDYSEQWSLGAPGGVETISLTGTAFVGYYTGGNHKYEIFSRSATEMILRTTDGNNEFDWWFTLTTEEEGATNEFETTFTNLVWEDGFDTDGAPDPTNWTYDLGTGTNGWGNNEVQSYTSDTENVIVEGGFLKITAKTDGGGGYTSARIKSQGLQKFTYGRVDVRAKLPSAQGTWPAIWMLGSNFPSVGWPQSGEIDIMEQRGDDKNNVLGTLHWLDSGNNNASFGESTSLSDVSSEFHVYSVDWSADKIYILIDNEPYFELDNNETLPFNADFFLILNVAMGGTLGGTIDPMFTEDTMEIDYVRVYQ